MSQQRKTKNIWKIGGIGLLTLVLLFIGSRILPIIRGAEVRLDLPKDSEVSEPIVALNGIASDTKALSVNGSPVSLSPDGKFAWTVLLHPGYNTITVDTTDARNHNKKQTYAFLLKELPTGTFALSTLPNQN
jgi:hypothetical protein